METRNHAHLQAKKCELRIAHTFETKECELIEAKSRSGAPPYKRGADTIKEFVTQTSSTNTLPELCTSSPLSVPNNALNNVSPPPV